MRGKGPKEKEEKEKGEKKEKQLARRQEKERSGRDQRRRNRSRKLSNRKGKKRGKNMSLSLLRYDELVMPVCVCTCTHVLIQSYVTLCYPMECSPPGSSIHGIFQARILEQLAMTYSRRSPNLQIELTSLAAPVLMDGFFTTAPPWKLYNALNSIIFPSLQSGPIFCQFWFLFIANKHPAFPG